MKIPKFQYFLISILFSQFLSVYSMQEYDIEDKNQKNECIKQLEEMRKAVESIPAKVLKKNFLLREKELADRFAMIDRKSAKWLINYLAKSHTPPAERGA